MSLQSIGNKISFISREVLASLSVFLEMGTGEGGRAPLSGHYIQQVGRQRFSPKIPSTFECMLIFFFSCFLGSR